MNLFVVPQWAIMFSSVRATEVAVGNLLAATFQTFLGAFLFCGMLLV
jgi:hypothetical protein